MLWLIRLQRISDYHIFSNFYESHEGLCRKYCVPWGSLHVRVLEHPPQLPAQTTHTFAAVHISVCLESYIEEAKNEGGGWKTRGWRSAIMHANHHVTNIAGPSAPICCTITSSLYTNTQEPSWQDIRAWLFCVCASGGHYDCCPYKLPKRKRMLTNACRDSVCPSLTWAAIFFGGAVCRNEFQSMLLLALCTKILVYTQRETLRALKKQNIFPALRWK